MKAPFYQLCLYLLVPFLLSCSKEIELVPETYLDTEVNGDRVFLHGNTYNDNLLKVPGVYFSAADDSAGLKGGIVFHSATELKPGVYNSGTDVTVYFAFSKRNKYFVYSTEDCEGYIPSSYDVQILEVTNGYVKGEFTGDFLRNKTSGDIIEISHGEFLLYRSQ